MGSWCFFKWVKPDSNGSWVEPIEIQILILLLPSNTIPGLLYTVSLRMLVEQDKFGREMQVVQWQGFAYLYQEDLEMMMNKENWEMVPGSIF